MTDEPEPEVIGHEVWSRYEEKYAGCDEQQPVDDDPLHMTIGFALQIGTCDRDRRISLDIVGIVQPQLALVAQAPQQALLGNLLGDPAETAVFHPLGPAPRPGMHADLSAQPLLLNTRKRFFEVRVHLREPSLWRHVANRFGVGTLVLAIELVPVFGDRNDKNVH